MYIGLCFICIVVDIAFRYHTFVRKGMDEIEEKSENYKQVTPFSTKHATVFFGDSITEFCPLEDIYASYMKLQGVFVINRGIRSEQTGEMLRRLDDTVLKLEPRNLVMLMGINDMLAGVKQEDIVNNIREIIRQTKKKCPQTNILLQSIYPINKHMRTSLFQRMEAFDVDNEAIKRVNKQLFQLAKDEGIKYIDVYDVLIDQEGDLKRAYSYDGLHPNTKGYLALRDHIIENLR